MSALPPRVGIVTGVLHPRYGGPAAVVDAHLAALEGRLPTELFAVVDREDEDQLRQARPRAKLFVKTFPRRWYRGRGLVAALRDGRPPCSLLHAHMLWDHPVYAAWRAARSLRIPLIVSPHGSVSAPWRYRGLHKRIYRALILRRVLSYASCVHALNAAEAAAIRSFGVRCTVCIIGNGLPEDAFSVRQEESSRAIAAWPCLAGARLLLFVGRLGPEKGLEALLEAWAAAKGNQQVDGWKMVIAGPDYRGHLRSLRRRVAALGLSADVVFTGFVEKDKRRALTAACDAFVLPSRSEALSMALLEAAASGRPVLYTATCNFPALARSGGGWEVDLSVAGLARGLATVTGTSREALLMAGGAARRLVRDNYHVDRVADALVRLYAAVTRGELAAVNATQ